MTDLSCQTSITTVPATRSRDLNKTKCWTEQWDTLKKDKSPPLSPLCTNLPHYLNYETPTEFADKLPRKPLISATKEG